MSTDKPEESPKEDPKVILRKSLDDAFTLYVRDYYAAARDKYTAIIGTDPANKEAFLNAEAHFWRGIIACHSDGFEEAEQDFSALMDIGTERKDSKSHARGIAGLAFLLFHRTEYDEAERHAQNALNEGTNDPFVHCILGDAYWGKKDYQHAIVEYKKAADIDQSCFFAQGSVGFVQWRKMNDEWEKSAEAGKPLAQKWKEDQAREPIRWLKRALKTRPDYVNGLWNYAAICANILYTKKAIELCEEILKKYNPDHKEAKDLLSTRNKYTLKEK